MIYICDICGKEFDSSNKLNGHKVSHLPKKEYCCDICGKNLYTTEYGFKHHVTNHSKIYDNDFNRPNDNCYCKFCNKKCKNLNSLRQHEVRCKNNPDKIVMSGPSVDTFGDSRGWSKGLTSSDNRISNHVESLKNYYRTHPGTFTGLHHTEKTKKKISESMIVHNFMNTHKYYHSKWGCFEHIHFDSTWELAYYIYMKDNGHTVDRCKQRFKYMYNGMFHYYHPDFIVDNVNIVEIKGYEVKQDLEKYKAVDNIQVLHYEDIKHMIDYCKKKYSVSDLSELYNKRKKDF